ISHPPFADQDCETCHEKGEDGALVLVDELSTICAACHESVDEAANVANQHAPFAAGECVACHRVHAADLPHLLKAEGEQLCLSCHEEVKKVSGQEVMHQPFKEGKCLDCHKPHASPYAALTTKPAENFCLDCHTDLEKELALGEPHQPVVGGECTVCHNSHRGPFPSLLTATKDKLCGRCHKLASVELRTAHGGFDIAGANCQNCHAAHSGRKGTKGLLLPETHAPFAAGECSSCHQGKNVSIVATSVKNLCVSCHDDFAQQVDKTFVHNPVTKDDGCLHCHGPHVGFGSSLQVKDGPKTCLTCHNDAEFSGTFRHEIAFEDCGNCHQPHAGDHEHLLETPDIIELCQNCHDDASKTHYHPMGPDVTDPRTKGTLTCTGCHSPHSSNNASILIADKNRKLCVLCHSLTH
ncbi:MAG: cytochrome c3 family protein, partial [Candidatus Zixiibacteriota bacterium]